MKTSLLMLASALAVAGCSDSPTTPSADGKINVVDWATEMARAERPDTIQDKFEIVVDTDDPAAFAGVIDIAKEQAAAAAAE